MIRFACPGCQTTFTVDDAKGGKAGTCPKCQARFLIPAAEPGASSSPPPSRPSAPPPPPPADPNAAVEISPCPKCGTRLSVSPTDLGSDVECPYCQTVFAAKKSGGSAVAPPPPPKPPKKSGGLDFGEADTGSGSRRKPAADEDEDRPRSRRRRDEDEEEEDRPSRRQPVDEDEDDDRPRSRRRRDEEDEEDDRPRKRKKKRRSGGGGDSRYRVTSAVLGILIGLGNLACGGAMMVAGPAVAAAIGGVRRDPNAPANVQAAGNALAGVMLCCGSILLVFAVLYLTSGVASLMRKPLGRYTTIACAGFSALLALLTGVGLVMNLAGRGGAEVTQILINVAQLAFFTAHAGAGFMATLGADAADQYDG